VPSVDITNAALAKAVAEIAALTEPPALEEGEITSLMLAETKGITRRKAAAQLEKACEGDSPILTMRKVQYDGRRVNAYSQVAPVTESVTNVD